MGDWNKRGSRHVGVAIVGIGGQGSQLIRHLVDLLTASRLGLNDRGTRGFEHITGTGRLFG